jgi:ABC-type transport system involved in multi-copper enzyme maturation permease subunit
LRTGTALAVLAKPVGRAQFLLAKYTGLICALVLLTYVNLIAALLASRMAFDAYGSTDLFAVGIFALGMVVAYLLGGFSNFFLRRPFVSDAVLSVLLMVTIAFVLILFALWILAGLALACSTRLDIIPTLAICSALFLLGIMSDYVFGRRADPVWRYELEHEMTSSRWSEPQKTLLKEIVQKYDQDKNGSLDSVERAAITPEDKARMARAGMGGRRWASVLYSLTPNWQLFWLADTLDSGKSTFHWGYVGKAFMYMLGYVGAVLAAGIALFEERELS